MMAVPAEFGPRIRRRPSVRRPRILAEFWQAPPNPAIARMVVGVGEEDSVQGDQGAGRYCNADSMTMASPSLSSVVAAAS